MSTIIIDDKTYINIYTTLTNGDYCANGSKYNLMLNLGWMSADRIGLNTYKYNKNNQQYQGIFRFIGVLRANNTRAYNSNYSHRKETYEYKTDKFKSVYRRYKGEVLSPCQLLKSLQAISYNLNQFDNKELIELINGAKDVVIDQLPEYKTAIWG